MTGHHGLYSKKYFYKEVINSPTIVSHPKHGKGKVVTCCVELLDISKTMVTLYGCSHEDIAVLMALISCLYCKVALLSESSLMPNSTE